MTAGFAAVVVAAGSQVPSPGQHNDLGAMVIATVGLLVLTVVTVYAMFSRRPAKPYGIGDAGLKAATLVFMVLSGLALVVFGVEVLIAAAARPATHIANLVLSIAMLSCGSSFLAAVALREVRVPRRRGSQGLLT